MLRQTRSLNIQVLAPLSLTISGPVQTYIGMPQTWRFSSPDAVLPADLIISWGDGSPPGVHTMNTSYVDMPHTYNSAGNFQIVADIEDINRNTGSAQHNVLVNSVLTISLMADNTRPAPREQILFSLSMSGGFPGYTWTLDPGDGSAPYGGSRASAGTVTQTHTYVTGGQTYTAVLTVEDVLGNATQMSLPIGVGGGLNGSTLLLPLLAAVVLATGVYLVWKS